MKNIIEVLALIACFIFIIVGIGLLCEWHLVGALICAVCGLGCLIVSCVKN